MTRRKLYKTMSTSLLRTINFHAIFDVAWTPDSSNTYMDICRKKENRSVISKSHNPRVPGYHLRQPKKRAMKEKQK